MAVAAYTPDDWVTSTLEVDLKGVKCMFAHDTEIALAATAALVNTGRQSQEQLPDVAALDAFVEQWRWTRGRAHDDAELEAGDALCPRLGRLWGGSGGEAGRGVQAGARGGGRAPP